MTVERRLNPTAEHHRDAAHRAVNRILEAWPHALLDAGARGFPTGGADSNRSSPGGHSDPTSNAALAESAAVAWLAELGDVAIALGVGRVGQRPGPWHTAADWLAEQWPAEQTVRDRLYRLADMAALHWPPAPTKGAVVGGVTVGARSNDIEVCALCGEPVATGRNASGQPLTRRIDGEPYHNLATGDQGACWWQVWRQRRRA